MLNKERKFWKRVLIWVKCQHPYYTFVMKVSCRRIVFYSFPLMFGWTATKVCLTHRALNVYASLGLGKLLSVQMNFF